MNQQQHPSYGQQQQQYGASPVNEYFGQQQQPYGGGSGYGGLGTSFGPSSIYGIGSRYPQQQQQQPPYGMGFNNPMMNGGFF